MPVSLPPATEVEVVIVHPPRLAPLGGEAAFSAIRIPQEDLRVAPRLDEVLRQAPGASLFRRTTSAGANPTTQGVSLRAIAPSGAGRALVTLDGAPQNDPFGGWVIWSALAPEGLQNVTVVRGAGAGPYGAGALTGVVLLNERDADGGLGAFDISAGQRNSYRVAVSGGGPGVLITAGAEKTDGYTPVRGAARGAADQRMDMESTNLAIRAQRSFGEADGAVRLGYYREERGAGLAGARSTATGFSATATLARTPDEGVGGWRIQAWTRLSDLKNSSAAVAAGRVATTPANEQYSTPAEGYGLNAAIQGKMNDLSWEVGLDGRLTDGVARERFRYMNGAFTRNREAGGRTTVGGAYVEAALNSGDWIVTGGARVDAWRSSGAVRREWDITANNALVLDQTSAKASGVTPTGRFGVRYTAAENLWLRGAAYAGFRPPTLNELHRPFRVGNDITEANASLKPEKLFGVDVGIDGQGWARWSLGGFYNLLQDPITNVTIGIGPGTFPTAGFIPAGGVLRQRQNAGEIEAWGLEGDASGDLAWTMSWRAAFAATRARVDGGSTLPQLTGKRPAQTPSFTAVGGLDWRPNDVLTFSADARYESKRFEDDLNLRVLGAGAQLDLRAGWRVTRNGEIYLAADNVADKRFEVGETADGVESYAAPRTIRVGFAWRR